ncbi:MAG TPA: DotU family type IV/VI secretion system protein, partial [Rhodothermales bacterium]|nr:DotU family type IV/VI secretion system protein [Rhodothermales bacterium]
ADHLGNPDELRRRAVEQIEAGSRAARRNGGVLEDVRDAEFALVALIDEAVMSSQWEGREQWAARPLQLERYERFDAGEVFFERLDALRGRPDGAEVLEVYFLCLTLGFKGRYQFASPEELRRLIEEVQSELLGRRDELPPLAPHGLPRSTAEAEGFSERKSWPLVVGALVLVLLLYVGARLFVGAAASDARATVAQAQTAASTAR